MKIQGTYTNKGLALTAKTAAGACLRVTRVVGGSGHTPDIPGAAALSEIRQTLAVGEARRPSTAGPLTGVRPGKRGVSCKIKPKRCGQT